MAPSPLVSVVLFGWLPAVLVIFALLPAQRAVIVSFVLAWLFLPIASFHLPGVPSYDKMTATCVGVLLAAILFDSRRISQLSFCPRFIDIPVIALCLCPLATALANDPELTTHDGLSWAFQNIVTWGLPYLIGRIYLENAKGLRDLAIAIFIGGLVYVPPCLYEIRMSPQLHRYVYGYNQHSVAQQARGQFFRPMVFMEHGLALGLFMTAACLAGFWLWQTGSLKRLGKFTMPWLLAPLWITTVLCRSDGALAFLGVGTLCLLACRWMRSSVIFLIILLIPPAYLSARIVFGWDGEDIVGIAQQVTGEERAHSLAFRIFNERMITEKAKKHLFFGWGGYGRPFILDEHGNCKYTPDSLWIITFGFYGLLGLGALYGLLVPVGLLHLRLGGETWGNPYLVGVSVFSVLLVLYSMDNLMNNMPNPLFLLGLGGLCGIATAPRVSIRQRMPDDLFQLADGPSAELAAIG